MEGRRQTEVAGPAKIRVVHEGGGGGHKKMKVAASLAMNLELIIHDTTNNSACNNLPSRLFMRMQLESSMATGETRG